MDNDERHCRSYNANTPASESTKEIRVGSASDNDCLERTPEPTALDAVDKAMEELVHNAVYWHRDKVAESKEKIRAIVRQLVKENTALKQGPKVLQPIFERLMDIAEDNL